MELTQEKKDALVQKILAGSIPAKDVTQQAGISIEEIMGWTQEFMRKNPEKVAAYLHKEPEPEEPEELPAQTRGPKGWTNQPCWDCINAVPNEEVGCPWSRRFEPVPGWDATHIVRGGTQTSTYAIHWCPLFKNG